MDRRTSGLDEVELSDLIGEIYDCAIDPIRWEPTLDRVSGLLDCVSCMLVVTDLQSMSVRLCKVIGVGAEWVGRIGDYAEDVAELNALVPDFMRRSLDEPFVGLREVSSEAWRHNNFFREWAAPQGLLDVAILHMMRGPKRIAQIAFCRHEDVGLITDREVRLLRLIAPHLRRAVVISDLIDMKSIEAEALGRTLDRVPARVALVAEDAEILHANRTADRMIDEAAPIASSGGKLSVANSETTARLRKIVAAAARNESEIGSDGIGMALAGHAGPPATAHVLPIATGALRSRLVPRGAAAVFVASERAQPPLNLAPVVEAFDLSQAEARVLERLMLGDSLPATAAALSISQNTAKTHLSRLFAKTGTQRQANLVALVSKLVPPVAPPGSSDG